MKKKLSKTVVIITILIAFTNLLKAQPEINIRQNTIQVPNGGSYDFGTVIGYTDLIWFTIENNGTSDLHLNGEPFVIITGTNSNNFPINQPQYSDSIIGPGKSANFSLQFTPECVTNIQNRNAVVSILNNDSDEGYYTFNIVGTVGVANPPTIQTSNIVFSNITEHSVKMEYTKGNGTNRLILMKKDSPVDFIPVDLEYYYGVYNNASSNTLNIDKLEMNSTYYFAIYEYNSSCPNYLQENPATGYFTTLNIPLNIQDSLALVSFYNSMNGTNWTYKYGWLYDPVYLWKGITVEMGRVVNLTLINNNVVGNIPSEIGNLTGLKVLNLFGFCDGYKTIDCSGWRCQGFGDWYDNFINYIPPQIGNLSSLEILNFGSTNLSTIPTEIGNLGNLKELYLHGNNISSIPTSFSSLSNLELLALGENNLTEFPNIILSLNNLQTLSLCDNPIPSIPNEITNLEFLKKFYFSYTEITEFPTKLTEISSIELIDISECKITDEIPITINNLQNLIFLDASRNQISGSIPLQIGYLPNLEFLRLSENKLSGNLPVTIAGLTNLKFFDLSSNQLSGNIPNPISNLTSINTFNISGNHFTSLPNITNFNFQDWQGSWMPTNSYWNAGCDISYNNLLFDHIEPNISAFSMYEYPYGSYGYQDSVGLEQNFNISLGSSLTLNADAGSSINNQYQWTLNNVDIPNANSNTYTITNANCLSTGYYSCKITNTVVKDMTLNRRFIKVSINSCNPSINNPVVTENQHCSDDEIKIYYTVTGVFDKSNIFTVQLSNSNGNFSNPTTIGCANSFLSDTIFATLDNITIGSGYRIRILSSNPFTSSGDNGVNLSINQSPQPPTVNHVAQCDAGIPILVAQGASDGLYRWFDSWQNRNDCFSTPIYESIYKYNENYQYFLLTNDTLTNWYIDESDTFYVSIINPSNNCLSDKIPAIIQIDDPSSITGKPIISASSNIIPINGNIILSLPANLGEYYWYKNSIQLDNNNDTLIVNEPGIYNVVIYNSCGLSPMSDPISIISTNLIELNNMKFKIYPNPCVSNILFIETEQIFDYHLTIYNLNGVKVLDRNILSNLATIDIETLQNGIYIVCIQNNNNTKTFKIIKN